MRLADPNTPKPRLTIASAGRGLRKLATGIEAAKFEWCLVSFAVGIGLYFSLHTEPSAKYVIILLICAGILSFLGRHRLQVNHSLLLIFTFIAGLAHATLHTKTAKEPILPEYRKAYTVEGWIENARRSGELQQFYIKVDKIHDLEPERTPKKVRIRIKPNGFKPGDAIKVRAVLNRPPMPVLAGGFDSGRRAYFEQIGGYGFAVSTPERIDIPQMGMFDLWRRKLIRVRSNISQHIQSRAPPNTAGLQAALLTGDRSAIPEAQEQSLRDAGLAHLLAISGLHMGLLAGGAYWLASLIFAMIGPWARRYDMRKWAAVIGALFATGYLLISGASISTQRAFIMALIVFAAVVLDRRAVSIRSVAVAAAITLLLHPESLLSAGFQMSFAATAALVVVYRYWADQREYSPLQTGLSYYVSKFWNGLRGLTLTSFVAGLATSGFAALHFHRIARYGFIGNLVAMPMFTLVAMPAGFCALIAMPLGLDMPFLWLMGVGLEFVLMASDWVSSRPGAISYIPAATGQTMALFSVGFVFLCLGPKWVRVVGGLTILVSLLVWANLRRPDMRISQSARIAFWTPETGNVLWVDSERADKFGRGRFVEQAGIGDANKQSFIDTIASCDVQGCRINVNGKMISVVYEPETVLTACRDSDVVVLTNRIAGPVAKRRCRADLIDLEKLRSLGAHDITIHNGVITIQAANPSHRKNRPWGG